MNGVAEVVLAFLKRRTLFWEEGVKVTTEPVKFGFDWGNTSPVQSMIQKDL